MPKQKNDRQNKNNTGQKKRARDTSWIDTDKVVNKAQRIVSSAVNVLEEEIAAGILAAKKIEKRLIDVEEIRSNPDDLINRIRRDSHEALDLYIDAFASISGKLNTIIDSLKSEKDGNGSGTKARPGEKKEEVMVLEPDRPLKPGDSTSFTITLKEDTTWGSGKISLRKSDFIGASETRIGQRAISISPRAFTVRGDAEKEVKITIRLPKNSLPGVYNALLTDTYNPRIRLLLCIHVIT